MKKLKFYAVLVVLCLFALAVTPNIYAANTIVAKPGNNTIKDAVAQAEEGDTIRLEGDGTFSGDRVVINKDITIVGSNKSRNYVTCLLEINGAKNVTLKDFSIGGMIINQQNHYLIDVKQTTNLTIENINLAYGGRAEGGKFIADAKNIFLESTADNNVINIKDSIISGIYNGLIIDSSNNTVNIDNSELAGNVALALKDGSNNKIYLKNNSRLYGRSTLVSDSEEAISIDGQQNLTIELSDSELVGVPVADRIYGEDGTLLPGKVEIPAHIISFEGNESSHVNISIKGNSKIEDQDLKGDSNIINFGDVVTPNNDICINIEGTVEISPDDIEEKYNNSDNIVIVGIKDYKGDWTIKPYTKDSPIPDSDIPKDDVVGYKLNGITYNTKEQTSLDYTAEQNVSENIDIISDYERLMHIKIDNEEETFYVKKGEGLDKLKETPKAQSALDALVETDDTKEFLNFVMSYTDDEGNEHTENVAKDGTYTFNHDTTISADYKDKVKVTLKVSDDNRITTYLDKGQALKDLSGADRAKFEEALKNDKKRVGKYVELQDDVEVEIPEDRPIDKDIVIVAKYVVDVTIGEEIQFTIDEGSTLGELGQENLTKLNSFKEAEGKDFKEFVKVTDGAEGETISDTTPITEHITLKPKFTIKVTIDSVVYTLDEGRTLSDLSAMEPDLANKLIEFENKEDKNFKEYVNENQEKVDKYEDLVKHTTITPVYTVTVTIGEEEFELPENGKLSELEEADAQRLLAAKGDRFSRFVDEEDTTVTDETPITKNTTLVAKHNISVTIDEEVYELEEEKTLNDIESTALDKLNEFENVEDKNFKEYKDGEGTVVTRETKLTKDTTITPYYTVTVTIGEEEFELDENTALNTLSPEDAQRLSTAKGDKFSRFVNEEGVTVTEEEAITKNTTLTVKHKVTVNISGQDYELEEGKKLNELEGAGKNALEQITQQSRFSRFVNEENETVMPDTTINKDMVLTAKFNVVLTIGSEEITIEEGKTLSELEGAQKEKLDAIKRDHELYQVFDGFRNTSTQEMVDENETTFEEDATLEVVLVLRKGDVDMNGAVDAVDAAEVITLYKNKNATELQVQLGNLDDTEGIDAVDAMSILTMYKNKTADTRI